MIFGLICIASFLPAAIAFLFGQIGGRAGQAVTRSTIDSFYKALKATYGFQYDEKGMALRFPSAANNGPDNLTISPAKIYSEAFIHILVTGGPFLPAPFLVEKDAAAVPGPAGPAAVLRLGLDDFAPSDEPAALWAGDREMEAALRGLYAAQNLLVETDRISALLPHRSSPGALVRATADAAVRLAKLFHERPWSSDTVRRVLNGLARRSGGAESRSACLRRLVTHHRNEPLTRETLQLLLNGGEFDIGAAAAKVLEIGLLDYVKERFDRFDAKNQARAIRAVGRDRTRAGADFLFGRYGRTTDPRLAGELIEALGEWPDERTAPFCLEALGSPYATVREAAVKVLGGCGGEEAVPPLCLIAGDERQTSYLRDRARESLAAIHTRLGTDAGGRLSLSETEAGALSVAEDAPGGKLSLAPDQDAADDSPSPEKRKH